MKITELFVRSGLASSVKEAKRLISSGGAKINDILVTDTSLTVAVFKNSIVIGKQMDNYFIVHECSLHRGCSGSRKRPG